MTARRSQPAALAASSVPPRTAATGKAARRKSATMSGRADEKPEALRVPLAAKRAIGPSRLHKTAAGGPNPTAAIARWELESFAGDEFAVIRSWPAVRAGASPAVDLDHHPEASGVVVEVDVVDAEVEPSALAHDALEERADEEWGAVADPPDQRRVRNPVDSVAWAAGIAT
jgi:hypothetical protein